ncbi:MAG: hypothetical protein KGJ86_22420, partial [Chloroflexota bacterium]|nr:hypothetical protein [Chloroflexota bacterium]
ALLGSRSGSEPAQQAAEFLASDSGIHDVLADDRYDFPSIFFSPNPAIFLTPDDRPAFDLAVSAPRQRLRYAIASQADGRPDDRVEARYPGLYAHGAGWADLAGEWPAGDSPAWRLYRVRPAP